MSDIHEKAAESLRRLKEFDVSELVQEKRLGENAFEAAIEPAKRVLSLYKKIPDSIVFDLSQQLAQTLTNSANSTYNRFQEIQDFDLEEGGVRSRRDGLVESLKSAYDIAFDSLLPIISFSISETTDFNILEERGRATLQAISDSTVKTEEDIGKTLENAQNLLEEVRSVAAEEGVLKQAVFFKDEATLHSNTSWYWLVATACLGAILLLYTGATLVFSQSTLFKSSDLYGTIQISVSKILVFSVLTYAVLTCSRNYKSNRHNAVVNKHRQNALMTYRTLSESGTSAEARDTILNHAAAAIYAPVDSGYVANEERGYGASLPAVSLSSRQAPASVAE